MPFKIHISLESRKIINYLLLPLTVIFYILSSIRKTLYQLEIIKTYKTTIPLIVVGNITVGGSGKTPIVINLVNFFSNKGKKVGVISRGYGRKNKDLIIVNNDSIAIDCGDEPLLIKNITSAIVVVSANKIQALKVLEGMKVDIIISDDGLQHYKMARDIEIIVSRGVGNGFLIPAGPLRETTSRLKNAEFIINNNNRKLKNISFINAKTTKEVSLDFFKNQECFAFCGIAKPDLFFGNLISLKIKLETRAFKDHYNYNSKDMTNFINSKKPVIMTAKDWVKCRSFATENMWFLQTDTKIYDEFYQKLENKLCLIKNY